MTQVPMNQNFNEDFRTLCGDVGAPAFFANFLSKDIDVRTQDIKKAVVEQIENYEVHIGCAYVLTDPDILYAMGQREVSMIVQKSGRLSLKLQDTYSRLGCTFSRQSISNRLAHCTHRNPKYTDIGIPDGVRWYGNIDQRRLSGVIPVGHHKLLISGTPTKNKSKINFKEASLGSYNFSINAASSFESWVTIKNPAVIASMVEMWVDLYSVSERLNMRRLGLTPDLTYTKKLIKYAGMKCPTCKRLLRTYPIEEENTLYCRECDTICTY